MTRPTPAEFRAALDAGLARRMAEEIRADIDRRRAHGLVADAASALRFASWRWPEMPEAEAEAGQLAAEAVAS